MSSYERISPTAWLTAYQRTLSNIPLAAEIFQELEEIVSRTRTDPEIEILKAMKSPKMAVMWEARYKIINHLLQKYPIDQFFEIAAGFSPRGLNMASAAHVTYVEVDLAGVIQEKRRIVESLVARAVIPARPNFHLVEGNALDLDDLISAARFFCR